MEARRRSVESDLVIDVFFTNLIRGKDGLTPYIGENRNWWIGDDDTGVCAEGKDGKDGATPVIGDNGNWWIDGVDQGAGSNGIPSGVIVMWSGNIDHLPNGWKLCDGNGVLNNGVRVPDLRGRFIVGYDSSDGDYNNVGKKGGSKKVVLNKEQIPKHNHKIGIKIDGRGGGGNYFAVDYDFSEKQTDARSSFWGGNNEGLTDSHENRPPYYVLAFIIKL